MVSCATSNITNIEDTKRFEFVEDEKNLWIEVEEMVDGIFKSGAEFEDAELNKYVNEVLDKVVGDIARKKDVEIKAYVIKNPDLNAFALPNGYLFLHTGIMAILDNEAQLATVLGHEATHFLHRHSLKRTNKHINVSAFMQTLRVASVGAMYGVAYSGYDPSGIDTLRQGIELGLTGAFFGYNRGQESEADDMGFKLMKEAGYDPNEAKKPFENMYEATKDERRKDYVPYMYQTHPKLKSRVSYMEKLYSKVKTAELKDEGILNKQIYMNKIRKMLIYNLDLDIRRNKTKLARLQIDKYKNSYGEDYRSLYYEAKLLLREEDKKEEAMKKLVKSYELNSNFPETLKELGLLRYKNGEKEIAKQNFERYLELQPDSIDADFIRGYLDE